MNPVLWNIIFFAIFDFLSKKKVEFLLYIVMVDK